MFGNDPLVLLVLWVWCFGPKGSLVVSVRYSSNSIDALFTALHCVVCCNLHHFPTLPK